MLSIDHSTCAEAAALSAATRIDILALCSLLKGGGTLLKAMDSPVQANAIVSQTIAPWSSEERVL